MPDTPLLDSLNELSTAIENRNYAQTETAFDEYQAAYEEVAPTERVMQQRSELAQTAMNLSSEEHSKLTNWRQQRTATSAGRMTVFSQGDLFLLDPQSADISEFAASVAELRSREQALNDRMTIASGVLSDLELPAHIAVLSADADPPSPVVGTTTSVAVPIANVGATPAESVSLTVESDLPVSPTETAVGSIAGGETETVSVEVTASETGRQDVVFTAESADAGTASETVTITVVPEVQLTEAATDLTDDLIERLENDDDEEEDEEQEDEDDDSGDDEDDGEEDEDGGDDDDGNEEERESEVEQEDEEEDDDESEEENEDDEEEEDSVPVALLQDAQHSINVTQEAIESGQRERAIGALTEAITEMGAFLNALDSSEEDEEDEENDDEETSSRSDAFVWSLEQVAQLVISQLARVREAVAAN